MFLADAGWPISVPQVRLPPSSVSAGRPRICRVSDCHATAINRAPMGSRLRVWKLQQSELLDSALLRSPKLPSPALQHVNVGQRSDSACSLDLALDDPGQAPALDIKVCWYINDDVKPVASPHLLSFSGHP